MPVSVSLQRNRNARRRRFRPAPASSRGAAAAPPHAAPPAATGRAHLLVASLLPGRTDRGRGSRTQGPHAGTKIIFSYGNFSASSIATQHPDNCACVTLVSAPFPIMLQTWAEWISQHSSFLSYGWLLKETKTQWWEDGGRDWEETKGRKMTLLSALHHSLLPMSGKVTCQENMNK